MKNNVIPFRNQATKKDDFSDFGEIKNLTCSTHPQEKKMALNCKVLTGDNEIADIAAAMADTVEPKTTGGALVRRGDVHGVPTLTIDIGGTVFVITD